MLERAYKQHNPVDGHNMQLILPNNYTTADKIAEAMRDQIISKFADPSIDMSKSESEEYKTLRPNHQGISTLFSKEKNELLFYFVTREGQAIKIGFALEEFRKNPIGSVLLFGEGLKQGIEAFKQMKQEANKIVIN